MTNYVIYYTNIDKVSRLKTKHQFDKYLNKYTRFSDTIKTICQVFKINYTASNELEYNQIISIKILLNISNQGDIVNKFDKIIENKFTK